MPKLTAVVGVTKKMKGPCQLIKSAPTTNFHNQLAAVVIGNNTSNGKREAIIEVLESKNGSNKLAAVPFNLQKSV